MILNINGKDYEIESITKPVLEFDQCEVWFNGKKRNLTGRARWLPVEVVASEEVIIAMINPEGRSSSDLKFIDNESEWLLEECYVGTLAIPLDGRFSVFYRYARMLEEPKLKASNA